MIFTNYCFCGDNHSLQTNSPLLTKVTQSCVRNALVDSVKLDNEANSEYINGWTWHTMYYADFINNLAAGNINYTIDSISTIRVKRRKVNTFNWVTLSERVVTDAASLAFIINDITAASHTDYEYALVPVMSDGAEGEYALNSVHSEFDGSWIVEDGEMYSASLNPELSTKRNVTTAVTQTLYRQYPFVHKLGKANYISGSMKALFVNAKNCHLDFDDSVSYRENVQAFLTNGKPKLIKIFDGRLWAVAITDSIEMDESNGWKAPIYAFNFTEIGDANTNKGLYEAGLVNVRTDE